MLLINGNLKQKDVYFDWHSIILYKGLSKVTRKLLKSDLIEMLKTEGIKDIHRMEVTLNVCVYSKSKKGDSLI